MVFFRTSVADLTLSFSVISGALNFLLVVPMPLLLMVFCRNGKALAMLATHIPHTYNRHIYALAMLATHIPHTYNRHIYALAMLATHIPHTYNRHIYALAMLATHIPHTYNIHTCTNLSYMHAYTYINMLMHILYVCVIVKSQLTALYVSCTLL